MSVLLDVMLAAVLSVVGFASLFQLSAEQSEASSQATSRLSALSALYDLEGRMRVTDWQVADSPVTALDCHVEPPDWFLGWCQRWGMPGDVAVGFTAISVVASAGQVKSVWTSHRADRTQAWRQVHSWTRAR